MGEHSRNGLGPRSLKDNRSAQDSRIASDQLNGKGLLLVSHSEAKGTNRRQITIAERPFKFDLKRGPDSRKERESSINCGLAGKLS